MTESPDERLGLPSASSWRRYELCNGSWQLEGEARRLNQTAHERSPAAQRGTLIHAFLAGQPDEDGREVVLTDTERTTADFLQERAQGEVQRIFGDGDQTLQQLNEKRLWLVLNGQRVASGQFDRVVYSSSVALVQDFKTSQWVEPDKSVFDAQMRVLAILVGLHLPDTIKEIVTQVITGPWGVYQENFTRKDLADIYDATLATLRKINDPLASLVPGISQCHYCPAATICQPCRDLLSPPTKFQTATLPLEPDRAAKMLDEIEILEGVFAEVKKFYAQRLESDPQFRINHYAMVPGAQEREITDWTIAKQRLGEFLEADQLELAASYGIGKIEASLAKVLKITKAQAKEKFNEILGNLVTLKEKKASLKRTNTKNLVTLELP